VEALQIFHKEHPDVAVRVNVMRHPFSFGGGGGSSKDNNNDDDDDDEGDGVQWKWKDDLNIYAGDEMEQYLLQSGLPRSVVRQLRAPGGLKKLVEEDPDSIIIRVLQQISQIKGYSTILSKENIKDLVFSKIKPEDLAAPRGKQVGELDVIAGEAYKEGLGGLGQSVDIEFDFDVYFRWYPVDSQRALLFARQFGSQEAFADALARRHFTKGQASGHRSTVLEAAKEVGLDVKAVKAMLDGEEFKKEVWQSYQDTTGKHGIRSIPNFTFNGPKTNGGRFRSDGKNRGEINIGGSGSANQFLAVFEHIYNEQVMMDH